MSVGTMFAASFGIIEDVKDGGLDRPRHAFERTEGVAQVAVIVPERRIDHAAKRARDLIDGVDPGDDAREPLIDRSIVESDPLAKSLEVFVHAFDSTQGVLQSEDGTKDHEPEPSTIG